jgi:hypothetical protein
LCATCSVHLSLLGCIAPIFGEDHKLRICSIRSFLQHPVSPPPPRLSHSLLRLEILITVLYSNVLNMCSSLWQETNTKACQASFILNLASLALESPNEYKSSVEHMF